MSFAVVQILGKQYLVQPGQKIKVENIEAETGKTIKFDKVLLAVNGSVLVGRPYLKNYSVASKILKHSLGEKIKVTKFRRKSRYIRRAGFRSKYTEVEIVKINST